MNLHPNPKDMIAVRPFWPWTVPAGRIFVLTALGGYGYGQAQHSMTQLLVNGALELQAGIYGRGYPAHGLTSQLIGPWCTLSHVPDCISFPAGSVLSVAGDGRAFGYTTET